MEIIFSTATGQRIQWDGLVWSSVDFSVSGAEIEF